MLLILDKLIKIFKNNDNNDLSTLKFSSRDYSIILDNEYDNYDDLNCIFNLNDDDYLHNNNDYLHNDTTISSNYISNNSNSNYDESKCIDNKFLINFINDNIDDEILLTKIINNNQNILDNIDNELKNIDNNKLFKNINDENLLKNINEKYLQNKNIYFIINKYFNDNYKIKYNLIKKNK